MSRFLVNYVRSTRNCWSRRCLSQSSDESGCSDERPAMPTRKDFSIKIVNRRKGKPNKEPVLTAKVEAELVDAADLVAQKCSQAQTDENKKFQVLHGVKADLLNKLTQLASETSEARLSGCDVVGSDDKLANILKSMTIEKTAEQAPVKEKDDRTLSKADKEFLQRRRVARRQDQHSLLGKLFVAEPPLNIFPSASPSLQNAPVHTGHLSMWKACHERELRILCTPAPRNLLEEMANWTDRGILWKFPIDNEQGIESDQLEPFYEHVFLERHLDPWCPKNGPVRHFMELICTGLSKNPYMTAAKKLEHIMWFKDYFYQADHLDILKISGAI